MQVFKRWLMRGRSRLQVVLCCHIPPRFWPAGRVKFPHPVGIVIGDGVRIGRNCQIYQNVTIGRATRAVGPQPVLEDDVCVYPGAVIAGGVRIGARSEVGAGAFVSKDVPPDSLAYGRNQVMAREVETR